MAAQDQPRAPRPVAPTVDKTSADMGTLVEMGLVDPPPTPSPAPPWEVPAAPAPTPTPTEQANEVVLQAALLDAGVEKTSADESAVDELAKLDPAAVAAVARWLKAKKGK